MRSSLALALMPLAVACSVTSRAPATSLLTGAIDLHVHSAPDVVPRALDDVAAAREARAVGLRAVVLKSHHQPTAARALVAQQAVPGIEVLGGVVLNSAVGGLNAAAVEAMARTEGARGRVVWLPTFESPNHLSQDEAPFPWARPIPVVEDGRVVPALLPVLTSVRDHDLVLATGHLSPTEALVLIAAAREAGVRRILVTHANSPPIRAKLDELRALANAGAYLELVPPFDRKNAAAAPDVEARLDAVAETFRALGPERIVLASDLGKPGLPNPARGLQDFVAALLWRGVPRAHLERALVTNPAALLGLPPTGAR